MSQGHDRVGKAAVVGVVQARMTSSRLPGKVLRPILGRPMLELLIERLDRSQTIDGLLIAITTNPLDDPLFEWCQAASLAVFRGSEHDVLGRFRHGLAETAPRAETIVRITSDCPLLDPAVVDGEVGFFLNSRPTLDYASIGPNPTAPNGSSVEVFTRHALESAFDSATAAYDREHVTPYIQRPESGFRIGVCPVAVEGADLRLSVDTPQDFALVSKVFEALYPTDPHFSLGEVVAYLRARPDIRALNAGVIQTTGPYAPTS